jgi:hypothetical protein
MHALAEAMAEKRLYKVTLTRYSKPRSHEQNNTIHMWFSEIAEFTGYSPAEIKDEMKLRFGPPPEEVLVLGEHRLVPKSTAEYSVVEMMDFMTQIQAWCAEWDIEITDPDPMLTMGD